MKIEDMTAIQQVIALYSFTFDCGNARGWADVFTKDGIWEFYGPKAETPSVKLIGSQQLHDFCIRQNSNTSRWHCPRKVSGFIVQRMCQCNV